MAVLLFFFFFLSNVLLFWSLLSVIFCVTISSEIQRGGEEWDLAGPLRSRKTFLQDWPIRDKDCGKDPIF
jgi:hypothetical protein